LCWILLLDEHGVRFEYLPGKLQGFTVTIDLSQIDIHTLKIQVETPEVLTAFSGSGKSSIINNKLAIPMHTSLIFKE
jgi:excinuclease UvrABC ATPase subunit